jgi:type II secretory pathway component PulF
MPVPSAGRRLAVTLLAAMPWPVVLFQFGAILPRYDKLFRDFNLKVDDFTGMLLNVSAWLQRNVLLGFAATLVLMGISVAAAYTVQSSDLSRGRRAAILLVVFGVPTLVFVLAWVGVVNTHRTLVQGLQK